MSPQVQESPSGSVASSGHERTTLVLGVNGQDGSYLAETLLAKGYRVVWVGRQQESRWVDPERDNFEYVKCDLMDLDAFEVVLRSVVPHFAFHFAAVHGSSGFPYEDVWKAAHVVNTLSLHGRCWSTPERRGPGAVSSMPVRPKSSVPLLPASSVK